MHFMNPRITTQRELRRAFWASNPKLSRRRITDYLGEGKMYSIDTRAAWVDWLDAMCRMGWIDSELAQRATLD